MNGVSHVHLLSDRAPQTAVAPGNAENKNFARPLSIDLGSPVGLEYYDQAPFKFNGKIEGARRIPRYSRSAAGGETANGWADSGG